MQVTVTEAARRQQIAEAAVEVVARHGFAGASFAKIVEHAGLSSTRLISYHFRDKSDLMMTTLISAISAVDDRMNERLDGTTDRVDMLRSYIEFLVGMLTTHPDQVRAIREIGANMPEFAPVLRDFRTGRLERQLVQGQREGVFGEFDVRVVARTIANGVDGADGADTDVDAYARELADLFIRSCVG
ncbi:TetR/AcrR family transcriptional regulator [Actinokineospora auranticolor]|uniref:AcrR family transcriptional regulator n=1 Tax=Actinokineospora auranticolor TaxID=155976 RepID=A0A2S6GS82_9PSEU|nr:TetR/AcrR family transcriptional regulator [Actinokineospora auranticolor]PPK68070.1 AcrR family transcriptional regulator [Actinokineospora auranticolor]